MADRLLEDAAPQEPEAPAKKPGLWERIVSVFRRPAK